MAQGTRLLSLFGDNALLDERAGELIAVAIEHGFPLYHALGTTYRGWIKVNTGDVAEGLSLLRSGPNAYSATGAQSLTPYYIALQAKASEIAGQIDDALIQWDNALQTAEKMGERWFAAELYRHKGQLMLHQGDSMIAEELYRKSLTIAEEQEARLWELRAAVSLAQLGRDQGRCSEARGLLAPIFGWFTEGFDTSDLNSARALLEELS